MISFPRAVVNGLKYCFTCNVRGRSPRSEYCWFLLLLLIIVFIGYGVAGAIQVFAIAILVDLIRIYGQSTLLIRRLHDHSLSGFLKNHSSYIFINSYYSQHHIYRNSNQSDLHSTICPLPTSSIYSLLHQRYYTTGTNRYGPDPLAPSNN